MTRSGAVTLAVLAASAAAPAATSAKAKVLKVPKLQAKPVFQHGVLASANSAFVRRPSGSLQVMYQSGASLQTRAISASGAIGAPSQVVDLQTSVPALAVEPNGTLYAAFSHATTAPGQSGLFYTTSSDGTSWSAPSDARSGIGQPGDISPTLQYFDVTPTLQWLGGDPVYGYTVAGGVFTQTGVGATVPVAELDSSSADDDFAGDINSAESSAGNVYISWDSVATPGGDFVRQAQPSLGPATRIPGPFRNEVQLAPGPKAAVWAAYSADGATASLYDVGDGTAVKVGKVTGVSATVLGVAPGPAGRIWVMWGDQGGVVVTRSNRAGTRFEQLQHFTLGATTLYRLAGDGAPGPLDLLVDEIPAKIADVGEFHARIRPLLSVGHNVHGVYKALKQGKKTVHVLKGYRVDATVTDAGDPVVGAIVKLGAKSATTNKHGKVTIELGTGAASVLARVTAPTYKAWAADFKL